MIVTRYSADWSVAKLWGSVDLYFDMFNYMGDNLWVTFGLSISSPMDFPHKGSGIRKTFPCPDVIMELWSLGYCCRYPSTIIMNHLTIYIIISQNIRHLLWNRGAWRFFHDTYLTIEVQGIRCTNHLHDSCPFTDVNPHFTAPGCRYYFKINSWWPIVTS